MSFPSKPKTSVEIKSFFISNLRMHRGKSFRRAQETRHTRNKICRRRSVRQDHPGWKEKNSDRPSRVPSSPEQNSDASSCHPPSFLTTWRTTVIVIIHSKLVSNDTWTCACVSLFFFFFEKICICLCANSARFAYLCTSSKQHKCSIFLGKKESACKPVSEWAVER